MCGAPGGQGVNCPGEKEKIGRRGRKDEEEGWRPIARGRERARERGERGGREEDRRGRALMYELAPWIWRVRETGGGEGGRRDNRAERDRARKTGRERKGPAGGGGGDKIFASKGIKYDFICRYYHHRREARGDLRELAVPLPSPLSEPAAVCVRLCAAASTTPRVQPRRRNE